MSCFSFRSLAKIVVLTLALALGMTGIVYAQDSALIKEAEKEGKVTWYTSLIQKQAVRPIVAAFEKKYPGVEVEVVAGRVTELLLKMLEEKKAGQVLADVSHGGTAFGALFRAGLIAQYYPAAAADYPKEYKDPNGYWTGQALSYLVPAINTTLVSPADEPKTMDDLLDPKWKGKIAWAAAMSQGGPPGFIGTQLGYRGQEKGMAFLKKLAMQRLVSVPANQRVTLDHVASGEYPMALCTFNHHSAISQAKGAPIKWLKLTPVTGTVDTVYLLKDAPHPNAAKLLIEYLLSKEGQEVFKSANYIPAHPDVDAKVVELKPQGGNFKVFILNPEDTSAHLKDWIKLYHQLFK